MHNGNFSDYIIDLATNYGLGTWDWIALIISIVSLSVALFSFFIARSTLFSQKRTEKNTQPLMNEDVQLFLVGQKLLSLLDSYVFFFALHYLLDKTHYHTYPSPHFWNYVNIKTHDLNESLFYNSQEKFVPFHNLIEAHEVYSHDVESIKNLVENSKSKHHEIIDEIVHLYNDIGLIISEYSEVLRVCFNLDDQKREEFFANHFFTTNDTKYFNQWCNKKNYEQGNVVRHYWEGSEAEQFLTPFINQFTNNAVDACNGNVRFSRFDFSKFLIRHINVILLNTPYRGKIIDFVGKKESESHGKLVISKSEQTTENPWVKPVEPITDSDSNHIKTEEYWFFYMKDHLRNTNKYNKKS